MKTDNTIRQDVLAELQWEPSIREEDIAVSVREGVVTLAGTVDNYAQRYAAGRALERVKGVRALVNDLKVSLPTAAERPDSDIAHAALHALEWHVEIPSEKIKVRVAQGWVTIEGTTDWEYQRRAAEAAVRPLLGVRGVTNLIAVTARPQVSDVRHRIESALKRQAVIDAGHIIVESSGQSVTLHGTVRSFAEKRDAERAAWSAQGVSAVHNELLVEPLFPALI